jgi:competence protein ComEA
MKKVATAIVTTVFACMAWAQVDLNKATEIDLDGLNGLGPALTREILKERQKAPFQDWSDVLLRVKGIGPQKATRLSAQGLRVDGLGFVPKPENKVGKP